MKIFLVRQAMRRLPKGHVVKDRKRPVSYDLLLYLGAGLGATCFNSYEVLLFKAAFALAFFGAFRVYELVSPSCTKGGGSLEEDVRFDCEVPECVVCRSKTGQLAKGRLGSAPSNVRAAAGE